MNLNKYTKQINEIKKRFAPSVRLTQRWHEEEIKFIDKNRNSLTRSDFIRNKTLN
jgi:hypothetical protein